MKLGDRIRIRRKAKKLTQTQLASKIGITQPSLSEIETGETKEIEAETLLRLSVALEANPFYLYYGKGPQTMVYATNENEANIVALFQLLDEANRKAWLDLGRHLLDRQGALEAEQPLALPAPTLRKQ